MSGAKKSASEITSEVLENILELKETYLCKSSEEMIYNIEEYNKREDIDKSENVIGSMDVVSLYPRIKTERAAEIVRDAIIQSKVEIEGIDIDELGKYLRA